MGVSEDEVRAEWRVPPRGPWIRDGLLIRAALVEVAAQAVACRMGEERGSRPVHGFLGALKSVRFHGDARPGDVLAATARVCLRFDRFLRVEFVVRRDETALCEGVMTLAAGSG